MGVVGGLGFGFGFGASGFKKGADAPKIHVIRSLFK